MNYSALVLVALLSTSILDLWIARTRLLVSKRFWVSYSILLPFQLLTNAWLTMRNIVIYAPSTILGPRLAGAPIEDIGFGFALILLTLTLWSKIKKA